VKAACLYGIGINASETYPVVMNVAYGIYNKVFGYGYQKSQHANFLAIEKYATTE
jgi:hypothetical protein